MVMQKEKLLKDKKKVVTPEEYQELVANHQKEINELKVAHLSFPGLTRCIFNIKFIGHKRKHILATDYNSTLLLAEMLIDNTLKLLATFKIHTDLIQDMLVANNAVYTCSADKLVMVTKLKLITEESRQIGEKIGVYIKTNLTAD